MNKKNVPLERPRQKTWFSILITYKTRNLIYALYSIVQNLYSTVTLIKLKDSKLSKTIQSTRELKALK
jgi:hypothetical protein